MFLRPPPPSVHSSNLLSTTTSAATLNPKTPLLHISSIPSSSSTLNPVASLSSASTSQTLNWESSFKQQFGGEGVLGISHCRRRGRRKEEKTGLKVGLGEYLGIGRRGRGGAGCYGTLKGEDLLTKTPDQPSSSIKDLLTKTPEQPISSSEDLLTRNPEQPISSSSKELLTKSQEQHTSSSSSEDSLTRNPEQPSSNGAHAAAGAGGGSSMEKKSLWSKLAQNVNVAGVSFSARVIVKDRHLAIPHVRVPNIAWIEWKALKARGFQGVLFDKDNTLTAPYGQSIWPPVEDALEECREVFDGRIALLSNSAGLYQYDSTGAEARILENRLGIHVIRHGQKKPAGKAISASGYFGCDPSLLIMVGDRYFTDVVYGNNNGLLTIRPAPLTKRGELFVVRQVRVLEERLVDWWCSQGCQPPKHELCDNPYHFIKDPGCW